MAERGRDFHFEGRVLSVYLPILWVVALAGVVASRGELGCAIAMCAHPWDFATQKRFFLLLLGPPLTIWLVWGIVAWIIKEFGHPH